MHKPLNRADTQTLVSGTVTFAPAAVPANSTIFISVPAFQHPSVSEMDHVVCTPLAEADMNMVYQGSITAIGSDFTVTIHGVYSGAAPLAFAGATVKWVLIPA